MDSCRLTFFLVFVGLSSNFQMRIIFFKVCTKKILKSQLELTRTVPSDSSLRSVHLYYLFPSLEEGGLATYRTAIVQNQHLAMLAKVSVLRALPLRVKAV